MYLHAITEPELLQVFYAMYQETICIGFRTRWYAYLRGPPNMPNYALGALA